MQFKERIHKSSHRMDGNDGAYVAIDVTGASVLTSASTTGLNIGASFCKIANDGANNVTITFNEPFGSAPIISSAFVRTADGALDFTSASTTSIVVAGVKRSDHSSLNNADFYLELYVPSSKV